MRNVVDVFRGILFSGCVFFFALCAGAKEQNADEKFEETAWEFLREHMPLQDRKNVSEAYMRENLRLALKVRAGTPWGHRVPEDIFLNAVLPYSSVGEDVDAWRSDFYEKFSPVVSDCENATQAVEKLNREMWKILGVVYSRERERPDQSPFHSIRLGKASCSGLSILLINACRAVGVPARFVGCKWRKKPGNHSWVEFWDEGKWHYIGAFDSPKANEAWFDSDVAYAEENDPRYAVYAATWKPTGTEFFAYWRGEGDSRAPIPAENVTKYYLQKFSSTEKMPKLSVNVLDAGKKRVSVSLKIVEKKSGKILASGITCGEESDFNRHFHFSASAGTQIEIRLLEGNCLLKEYVFPEKSELLNLSLEEAKDE